MRRAFALFAACALLLLVGLRALDPWPVEAVREGYFDTLQRLIPREADDLPVRVIDIDEASLEALGQWPWPRDRLADLTTRLHGLGAAVIAYDVLFAEPDRLSPALIVDDPRLADGLTADALETLSRIDHDAAFARALENSFSVLSTAARAPKDAGAEITVKAGMVSIGEAATARLQPLPGVTPIVPALEAAALGIGVLNVSPDGASGVVRRVPMVWQTSTGPAPGLALEALRVALDETTVFLNGLDGADGLASVQIGDVLIPTNDRGELRVRYRPYDPAMFVSAADVLADAPPADLADRIAGHVVLVGTSAAGLLDIRATPLGETVPGVSIHAQIVEQILSQEFLRRSDLIEGAEIAALLATGLVVVGVMAFGGAMASIAAGTIAALCLVAVSWFAFVRGGVLFDVTFPVISGFTAFSLLAMFQYVVADRDKRRIRASFSRYVSEDVLAEIEARGHELELGGELREVTVLFTDIRGFTQLSERTEPQALVGLLNQLFSLLTDRILAERGTIDKYIGDAIMAFWNAPIAVDDHPAKAALSALAMREAAAVFNRDRAGGEPVQVMIGLATGEACVGNIGSSARYNYSVVGDTVNRAARIEGACRHVEYDILVGAEVARSVPTFALLPVGRLALKGVSDRRDVYALIGGPEVAATAEFAELKAAHAVLLQAIGQRRDLQAPLTACREKAGAVSDGLHAFYARLPDRLVDFDAAHTAA